MIKFYNAGAGSGKTHTLSNELADFLTKGNHPSQVILTTFSKKSAEELKERVRKTLLKKNEPTKAAEMSNAVIGTVNAVCSQLVEKYALEIGISPQLRVLDEVSTNLYFNSFVNTTIADETSNELARLCNLFSTYENKGGGFGGKDDLKPGWPRMVKELASRFRAYAFTAEDGQRSKEQAVLHATEFFLTNAELTLEKLRDEILQVQVKPVAGNPSQADRKTIEAIISLVGKLAENEVVSFNAFAKASKNVADVCANANPWVPAISVVSRQYHRTPEFANEYFKFISLIYDTAFKLIENYQIYKQERGLIDFADQELLFLQMLEENQVVRQEIKATFKLVMVDEFQDSSPVQLAIFNTLNQLVTDAVWVGDPKQAIYGFRDSDTELFKIALDKAEEDEQNQIVPLQFSYRSRPSLVNAVNDIFTGIFNGLLPEEHIKLQSSPKNIELESRQAGYSLPALQVQFYAEKKAEIYYAAIANWVAQLSQSDTKVYDKALNTFRTIRGGDIALLFRSNAAVKEAAVAFRQQGIPVSCEAEGLQEQAEILWITSLLRLLINSHDPLAIANLAILENAVDDVEALLAKRLPYAEKEQENREKEIWNDEAESKWKRISPVAQTITGQQQLLAQMPLVQAISHLVTASGLARYCAQWGNLGQRMANVNKVIELASSYVEQNGVMGLAATFPGFLEHLCNCFTLPPSESADAVTLITVHKSKGLEWPMVIPVKLDVTNDDCKVLFNNLIVKQPETVHTKLLGGQTIIYLPWPFGSSEKVKSVSEDLVPNKEVLAEKLQAFKNFYHEEDRLLYVALTRARDYLVLPYNNAKSGCCIESPNRSNPSNLFTTAHWDSLNALANETPATTHLKGHPVLIQKFPAYKPNKKDSSAERLGVTFYNTGQKVTDKPLPRFITPSRHEKHDQQVTITPLNYNQPLLPLNRIKEDLYATVGTAIHNAFASWTVEKDKEERTHVIKDLMHRTGLNGHVNAAELDQRFESFWQFIHDEYAPENIIRELPLIQVTECNGTITNGIADLVLQTTDGLVLIDHKTFPGHFETMALNKDHDHYAGKYAGQLDLYKQMLEKSTGQKVVGTLLHYVVQGKVVEVN